MSRECAFDGCDKTVHAKGLCKAHRAQVAKVRPLTPLERQYGPTCTVDDCGRTARSRGLCDGHYKQARRGEAFAPLRYRPTKGTSLAERFWVKVDKTDSCWLWAASTTSEGYGHFGVAGRQKPAHRVAYELLVGPIPAGLELDHLCRVRLCVNPEHLEPVTRAENQRRAMPFSVYARRTHCQNGHELTPENTRLYIPSDGSQRRICRACEQARSRARSTKRVAS